MFSYSIDPLPHIEKILLMAIDWHRPGWSAYSTHPLVVEERRKKEKKWRKDVSANIVVYYAIQFT